jgi:hypothetical protein
MKILENLLRNLVKFRLNKFIVEFKSFIIFMQNLTQCTVLRVFISLSIHNMI